MARILERASTDGTRRGADLPNGPVMLRTNTHRSIRPQLYESICCRTESPCFRWRESVKQGPEVGSRNT